MFNIVPVCLTLYMYVQHCLMLAIAWNVLMMPSSNLLIFFFCCSFLVLSSLILRPGVDKVCWDGSQHSVEWTHQLCACSKSGLTCLGFTPCTPPPPPIPPTLVIIQRRDFSSVIFLDLWSVYVMPLSWSRKHDVSKMCCTSVLQCWSSLSLSLSLSPSFSSFRSLS